MTNIKWFNFFKGFKYGCGFSILTPLGSWFLKGGFSRYKHDCIFIRLGKIAFRFGNVTR